MSEPYRFSLSPETPFSFSKIFAHPGDLASYDPGKRRKHVCIVGAGIAGLAAAFELAQLGHDPVVLEAADRVGGRIRTHRFADGQHAEFGAMRIPASHHCTLHYAEKLDLQLRPFVNFNPLAYLHLRGMRSRIKDWHAVAERFLLDASERKDPFKLLEDHMRQAWVPLTTADKWRMFSSDLSPRLKEYDSISFWQWLCRINGISSEAFEYIGHSSGLVQYERASFLEVLIDYFGLFRLRQWEIVGGMDRLALGFARRLAGRIHLNSSVTAIAATASGVWVHWLSMQGSKKERFDYVICAVPAPRVLGIDFSPDLTATKRAAQRLTYASAAKTIFHSKRRFWEADGIVGGGSFTDMPIQQCWYPSDNAVQIDTADAPYGARFIGDDSRDGVSATYEAVSSAWIPRSREVSNGPGVFTASYTWEANAQRMLAFSPSERTDMILKHVRRLHPEVEEHLDGVEHFVWNEQSSPGNGAFAYFAPGEHGRYQKALTEPHPRDAPRVFFAGEHLSVAHAWIQGAIQTALTACIDVLQAP